MRFTLLSLAAAGLLAFTATSAEAQPRRFYNNYSAPRGVVVYPSINTSPYVYPNYSYVVPNYNYVTPAGYYNYSYNYNPVFGGYSSYYNYGYNNFSNPYYGGWRW